MHLDEDKRSLSGAVRLTGITARKARRHSGSLSLCAEEDGVISDTVTHCVCVKDGSSRASSSVVCLFHFYILIQLQVALLLPGRILKLTPEIFPLCRHKMENIHQDTKLSLLPFVIQAIYSTFIKQNMFFFSVNFQTTS